MIDHIRSKIPEQRLEEFDKATADGKGVVLIGPGSIVANLAMENVIVIECDSATGYGPRGDTAQLTDCFMGQCEIWRLLK